MDNKVCIIQDGVYTHSTIESEVRFNIHDGYYPLARVKTMYDPSTNPYFNTACKTQYGGSRITDKVYYMLGNAGGSMKYKKTVRYSDARYVNFYFGFFSALGITQLDYLPTNMFGETEHMMFGEPDVFCVGVVKAGTPIKVGPNQYQKARRRSRYYRSSQYEIEVNYKDITILVSEEKLRRASFAKTYYTQTVRRAILGELLRLQRKYGITFEDVPDAYLKNFVKSSKAIRTNSLVETLSMGRDVKENVFSNLNKLVV